jgi:hypothetical protein
MEGGDDHFFRELSQYWQKRRSTTPSVADSFRTYPQNLNA